MFTHPWTIYHIKSSQRHLLFDLVDFVFLLYIAYLAIVLRVQKSVKDWFFHKHTKNVHNRLITPKWFLSPFRKLSKRKKIEKKSSFPKNKLTLFVVFHQSRVKKSVSKIMKLTRLVQLAKCLWYAGFEHTKLLPNFWKKLFGFKEKTFSELWFIPSPFQNPLTFKYISIKLRDPKLNFV